MTHDVSDLEDGTVPLEPDRTWDLPAGPRTGHAASLNVPCSQGPAGFDFDAPVVSNDDLIAAEPAVSPDKQMELGTAWTPGVARAATTLDRPIRRFVATRP
jgi:hypothetical protein